MGLIIGFDFIYFFFRPLLLLQISFLFIHLFFFCFNLDCFSNLICGEINSIKCAWREAWTSGSVPPNVHFFSRAFQSVVFSVNLSLFCALWPAVRCLDIIETHVTSKSFNFTSSLKFPFQSRLKTFFKQQSMQISIINQNVCYKPSVLNYLPW